MTPAKVYPSPLGQFQALRNVIVGIGGQNDGEDLYQDLFIKMVLVHKKENQSPGAIVLAAQRLHIDNHRKQKRTQNFEEFPEPHTTDACPLISLDNQEKKERLRKACEQLLPPYKEVIYALIRGETDQETAAHLECSVETVRTRKKRATERLRRLVADTFKNPTTATQPA